MKLTFNDINIVPTNVSNIETRMVCKPFYEDSRYLKFPLIASPMETVISMDNNHIYHNNNINTCLPRNTDFLNLPTNEFETPTFISMSLNEFKEFFIKEKYKNNYNLKKALSGNLKQPLQILIDMANGHMKSLFHALNTVKTKFKDNIIIMAGNIANPETLKRYEEIGVDYARLGIGSGSVCLTSTKTAIHYPLASLISECSKLKEKENMKIKLVADGGLKSIADIIKALALGADYAMLGSIFNKCIEAASDKYLLKGDQYIKISTPTANELFELGFEIYNLYRGLSTKEVQKIWGKTKLRTPEGMSKFQKIEYNLSEFSEEFYDHLRSAMSYTNTKNLENFAFNSECITVSNFSSNLINLK